MVVPTLLYTHFFFLLCFLYLFALLPPRNTPLYTDITLLHFRISYEYNVVFLHVFYLVPEFRPVSSADFHISLGIRVGIRLAGSNLKKIPSGLADKSLCYSLCCAGIRKISH